TLLYSSLFSTPTATTELYTLSLHALFRSYAAAIKALDKVCLVDPEDVQMHYTAMLCYRGLQDSEKAAREEKLFRRFKVEESAQRSEEHTSELQSRGQLVCRLLLEKKNKST